VGDIEFQKKCVNKMAEFRGKGVTIVFVSHGMVQVEKICDRILWLDNHEANMTGDPKEVIAAYSSGKMGYYPSGRVTREQLSVFIIRALCGENFTFTTTPYFSDVPSTETFFRHVQKMKDLGITGASGMYYPNDNVTREQMAAFLVRASQIKAKQDPENFSYTTTPYFSDVLSTDQFFRYIQKLRDDSITTVTGNYNPNEVVTRAQMATFIGRVFYGESFTYTKKPWFSDVAPMDDCFKYVQKLRDEGIVAGYGN